MSDAFGTTDGDEWTRDLHWEALEHVNDRKSASNKVPQSSFNPNLNHQQVCQLTINNYLQKSCLYIQGDCRDSFSAL